MKNKIKIIDGVKYYMMKSGKAEIVKEYADVIIIKEYMNGTPCYSKLSSTGLSQVSDELKTALNLWSL